MVIQSWRKDAGFDGFDTGDHFRDAASTHQVTGISLCGADRRDLGFKILRHWLFFIFPAVQCFDGSHFYRVAYRGGCAVSVDIANILRLHVRLAQSALHT